MHNTNACVRQWCWFRISKLDSRPLVIVAVLFCVSLLTHDIVSWWVFFDDSSRWLVRIECTVQRVISCRHSKTFRGLVSLLSAVKRSHSFCRIYFLNEFSQSGIFKLSDRLDTFQLRTHILIMLFHQQWKYIFQMSTIVVVISLNNIR